MYPGILTFYMKLLCILEFQRFNILYKNFYVVWNFNILTFYTETFMYSGISTF